jgi:energy-coupling factor transporter ATP-binding protein EcfA2
MDFYRINERQAKDDVIELYPDFKVGRSKDLMVRGKAFYAIWDEKVGLWSTDEYDVQRLVDEDLMRHKEIIEKKTEKRVKVKLMSNFSTGIWKDFRSFLNNISDSSQQLDTTLAFSNSDVKKTDYVSRRLSYPLAPGDMSAYEEIISTLYDPEERAKIEWAIGAILSGDAQNIHKFLVLYGPGGSGKSTILNIIMALFKGYYITFEANALTSQNNAFSTEVFKSNPLVAIQHDGDLSKIADNSKLNAVVAHEEMTMNEKYKPSYTARVLAFLIMATNKPVKITDAKSGLIRRLIDVIPSGNLIPPRRYGALISQVDFELGAIAFHCLETYRQMGKNFYAQYEPTEMMLQTDVFYNYIETYYDVFNEQDGTTLEQAYRLYKKFCEDTLIEYKLPQFKFREELRNYFENFEDRAMVDGNRVRSWYSGFQTSRFKINIEKEEALSLTLDEDISIFDSIAADWPAQYATASETPKKKWAEVSTTLADLDTTQLHYIKTPLHHIVIDFDLKDENGDKSAELNLEAASQWPPTYAEYSKGGGGIHLHYDYDGDVEELSRVYSDGIEVKVFVGDSSLRRKFSKGNNIPVAVINSGLPLREKKVVIDNQQVKSERKLRELIQGNLKKQYVAGTKPSMDFIEKILKEAYATDLVFDLTDMRGPLMSFAAASQKNAIYCLGVVQRLQLKSRETAEQVQEQKGPSALDKQYSALGLASIEERRVFFDTEVFPNLFVISWKYEGADTITSLINPQHHEVEALLKMKLEGFNNRKYDNHILYAAAMGYSNRDLYRLSKKIISNDKNALFGEAYNLSHADIYDYSSIKQSLKWFEIQLGLKHMENRYDWDEPVPQDKWHEIVEYCENDVRATEAVAQDRKQDYIARQILADISGFTINDPTAKHAGRFIFGTNRNPQTDFVYTDLSKEFEGYSYVPTRKEGKSIYRDEVVGEGGYVYAEPGMYSNVALLDVASMHPTSIEMLNLFGPYTERFSQIKQARIAIKRGEFDQARKMLDGALVPYLQDTSDKVALTGLSDALKLVINLVYGFTSATFPNLFKDPRNVDNIVAKRGALFMIDLKHAVQDFVGKDGQKWTVAHIKTDSIKIPDATPEIIEFVMEFGEKWGYDFEHEATYEKMALVNQSTYIAWVAPGRKPGYWQATGAEFQHPYVYKKLFTRENIEFADLREPKFVKTGGGMFLDFTDEGQASAEGKIDELTFIGKAGQFTPVREGGGLLVREKDGKFHAVAGTKGYRWLESVMVETLEKQDVIDTSYFDGLVDDAVATLSKFGDVEWLFERKDMVNELAA